MLTRVSIAPEPIPWIALAAISIPILIAMAHSRLPMKNIAQAISKIGRLPHISLSFPNVVTDAAVDSKYADPTQM